MLLFATHVRADNTYLVTLETATQASADETSSLVDASAQHMIGVIEGTQSRVQTLGADFHPASVERAPMLSAMDQVSFDNVQQTWTFLYHSIPPDGTLTPGNDYKRILYFTKKDSTNPVVRGDTANQCLLAGVSNDACVTHLQAEYVVPTTLAADTTFTNEHVIATHDCESTLQCLVVESVLEPDSELEKITITMKQEAVSSLLGHALYADDTQAMNIGWQFNIGMMFVYASGSNMNIVEHFHVLEQAYTQTAISKVNEYTIARHVQFYLADGTESGVTGLEDLRMAKLEFLIDAAHVPANAGSYVRLSLDGNELTLSSSNPACAALQIAIDVANAECLNPVVTPGTSACTPHFESNVLRLVVPISQAQATSLNLGIEIAIETRPVGEASDSTNPPLLSILQLTAPMNGAFVAVCQQPTTQTFDSIMHVQLDVYNKNSADDSLELLDTTTAEASKTFSSIQSLLTVVLRPTDTMEAQAYFIANPNKEINLDDLYIAHSLDATLFTTSAVRAPTATRLPSQRSKLSFSYDGYTEFCPLVAATVDLDLPAAQTCILTHDYGINTDTDTHVALERAVTEGYYVHELQYIGVFDLTDADTYPHQGTILVQSGLEFSLIYESATHNVNLVCDGMTVTPAASLGAPNYPAKRADYFLITDPAATCIANLLDSADQVLRSITLDLTQDPASSDTAWLTLVYGNNNAARDTFHQRAFRTVRESTHSKIYWTWPVYDWAQNPLGLVDTSQIHLAWSITDGATPTSSMRRLLSAPHKHTLLHRKPLRRLERLYSISANSQRALKASSTHRLKSRKRRLHKTVRIESLSTKR